jgi:hypothetical protein
MAPDTNKVHRQWMNFMCTLGVKPNNAQWKVIKVLVEKRKTTLLKNYIAQSGSFILDAYPFYNAYTERSKDDVLEMPIHMKWITFFEKNSFYEWETTNLVIRDDDKEVIHTHFEGLKIKNPSGYPFFDLIKHHYPPTKKAAVSPPAKKEEERPTKRIKTEH